MFEKDSEQKEDCDLFFFLTLYIVYKKTNKSPWCLKKTVTIHYFVFIYL